MHNLMIEAGLYLVGTALWTCLCVAVDRAIFR